MSFPGKVLIADDEPHVRKFVSLILKRLGASEILEAENGEKAVEIFKAEAPDLTLLDVNMPKLDGLEALALLMDARPDAVVVMLTSVANRQTVEQCSQLGATDYLRKDLPRDEMQATLQRIIDESWGDAEESPDAP